MRSPQRDPAGLVAGGHRAEAAHPPGVCGQGRTGQGSSLTVLLDGNPVVLWRDVVSLDSKKRKLKKGVCRPGASKPSPKCASLLLLRERRTTYHHGKYLA